MVEKLNLDAFKRDEGDTTKQWEKTKTRLPKGIDGRMAKLLGTSKAYMRVQSKIINIAVNTPLEYGFHSVP